MLDCAHLLAPWLMWAGSVLLGWLFVRGLRLRISMTHWPRVSGIVRDHKIYSPRNLHGPGEHRPTVTIEYAAAGRKHVVQCDSPARMGFANKEHAKSTMVHFTVGKSVKLYVDPHDPQRAFLYPPETSALLMLSVGALFLLVVGVGIANGARHAACGT